MPEIPVFDKLPEDNARQGCFSEAELDALISHLPGDLQDFTKFAVASGMRKEELSKLTWRMIESDELRIPAAICKNREDRVLPLAGELAEIIERRRAALPREKNGAVQMFEFIFHRDGSHPAQNPARPAFAYVPERAASRELALSAPHRKRRHR